jgi:hypothetical protein
MPAVNQQSTRMPAQESDLQCICVQASPVAAGLLVHFDLASSDPRAVRVPATGSTVSAPAGFAITAIPNDGLTAGRVATHGIVQVPADGAISKGGIVTISSTSGKEGRAKAAVSGDVAIGFALETAADGDVIEVLLTCPFKVP